MNIYRTLYHVPKPEGIKKHKAHIVVGIAGLAATAFLVDDAGMSGENITIYQKRGDVGDCCCVIGNEGIYVCPGEREIEVFIHSHLRRSKRLCIGNCLSSVSLHFLE